MSCSKCNQNKKTRPIQEAVTEIKHIAEGWVRVIIPNVEAEKTAADRLKICYSCNSRIRIIRKNQSKYNYKCAECGCILEDKVRVLNESCDLKKW